MGHLEQAGLTVRDEVTEDMAALKQESGLPQNLTAGHTSFADGDVIEGHISAADVPRRLTEKPDIAGMPCRVCIGSPGMESGPDVEPDTVFSLADSGEPGALVEHS